MWVTLKMLGLISLAFLTFIGYKRTNKQAKYIFRCITGWAIEHYVLIQKEPNNRILLFRMSYITSCFNIEWATKQNIFIIYRVTHITLYFNTEQAKLNYIILQLHKYFKTEWDNIRLVHICCCKIRNYIIFISV